MLNHNPVENLTGNDRRRRFSVEADSWALCGGHVGQLSSVSAAIITITGRK